MHSAQWASITSVFWWARARFLASRQSKNRGKFLRRSPQDQKHPRCPFLTTVDLIVRLTATLMPAILHLGAAPQHLSLAQLRTVKAEFPKVSLMRSIPVVDESSIALARSYDGIADWLLLDSYESGDRQVGALGVTHSWELDRRIIESVRIPTIIAGGLGPENVQEAIRVARPAGVDSKTKTDKSDGSHTKDLQKVSAFVKAARGPNCATK
jgi:phosphoribosylanthranilate isomerase